MCNRLGQARIVVPSPPRHLGRIGGLRSTKACFAVMGLACGREGCPRCGATTIAAFDDAPPLHVRYLRQNSDDNLADTSTNGTKAVNMNRDAHVDQSADGRLDIERITAEPINCRDVEGVAFADVVEQLAETGAIGGGDQSAHIAVVEFLVEASAKFDALRVDALIAR